MDGDLKKLEKKLNKLWAIGTDAMRTRRYDRAIKAFETVLRIDDRNATAHNRLGIVYAKLGEYDKSLSHFKKATKYENSPASQHNLGLLYFEIGEYKKAKKHVGNALKMEKTSSRYVALAKVEEKLKNHQASLEHLEQAMKLEPSSQIQRIYIDAYARYGSTSKKLSEELLEAIQKNDVAWNYEVIDDFPVLIDVLKSMHSALQNLVFSKPRKKLSLRDENARSLMIAYMHNLNACIPLLDRNYSLASANIARSMFEIYLKMGYGMQRKTNIGFAEIERAALNGKLGANNRLLNRIAAGTPLHTQKVTMNRELSKSLQALDRRYKKFQPVPSHREVAVLLDGGTPGENFQMYEELYEKGSDIIHAERSSISRSIQLSNTRHAGLFMDSYATINSLIALNHAVGAVYVEVPALSTSARNDYHRAASQIKTLLRTRKK